MSEATVKLIKTLEKARRQPGLVLAEKLIVVDAIKRIQRHQHDERSSFEDVALHPQGNFISEVIALEERPSRSGDNVSIVHLNLKTYEGTVWMIRRWRYFTDGQTHFDPLTKNILGADDLGDYSAKSVIGKQIPIRVRHSEYQGVTRACAVIDRFDPDTRNNLTRHS